MRDGTDVTINCTFGKSEHVGQHIWFSNENYNSSAPGTTLRDISTHP